MSPEQIDIARRAMTLLGVPKVPSIRPYSRVIDGHMGVTSRRGADGVLWVDVADKDSANYDWLPDITDPATGGIFVSLLGADVRCVVACVAHHERAAGLRWWADVAPDGGSQRVVVGHLAEACCLVALAVGRWAGAT